MKAETRKRGKKMSDEELQALDPNTLINNVTKFMRTDFGGRAKEKIALNRALESNPLLGGILKNLSPSEKDILGASIALVAADAVNGSRKRVKRTVNEMRRRWGTSSGPKKPKK
jgi:hypothetical protein